MFRVLLLVTLLFLPAVALAADPLGGFYIGGNIGANFVPGLESSQNNTKLNTSAGPVGLASFGYQFADGLRVELEGSVRSNSISSITTLRTTGLFEPLTNVSGNLGTYAAMANVGYDLPYRPLGITPYVGAGLGIAWLDLGSAYGNGLGRFVGPNGSFIAPDNVTFGSADALAYQVMAGASMKLTSSLDATVEYRFFGTGTAEIPVNRFATSTPSGSPVTAATRNGFSALDSAILLGLRYHFGAP